MTERTLWGAGAAFALCDVRDVPEERIAEQREMDMPGDWPSKGAKAPYSMSVRSDHGVCTFNRYREGADDGFPSHCYDAASGL